MLAVVKRSGVTEPFSRAKVIIGVRRACQGRPVDEDALALLSQQVEEEIRAKGTAEVSSHEVGLAILGPLRKLDEVAYLRFASVYRSFESVDDFASEILRLRADRSAPGDDAAGVDAAARGSAADKLSRGKGASMGSASPSSATPAGTAPDPALSDSDTTDSGTAENAEQRVPTAEEAALF